MIVTILATLYFSLLILPVFFPKHYRIRYYICYASYAAYIILGSCMNILLQLLSHSLADTMLFATSLCIFKVLGLEMEIRNFATLDKYKKAVIVLNHQTIFDFIGNVMLCIPANNFVGVFKKEVFYILPLGLALKAYGTIFVDREKKGYLAMDEMKKTFMKKETKIVIFPEGTRNKDGCPFLPFKKGAFRLAIEFQSPIIPIVISPHNFITPNKNFVGGRIVYSIMEPIPTTNLEEKDIDDLIKKTKELMEEEYIKLKNELSDHASKQKN